MTELPYRGRFAPSPTGPLHFGSLVTALASYLEARHHNGQWLVRIEDLDPLRDPPEATGQILHSLEAHRLISDGPIRFQSERGHAYQQALLRLLESGHAYYCTCSRRQLNENHGRHVSHCRQRYSPPDRPYALRFALLSEESHWQDLLLGPQVQTVTAESDDPVLQRKEGFYAYQLAVAVDDIEQQINHVVRGSDLLPLTAQQQQVFRALRAEPPGWLHIPVVLNGLGQKLSKQNRAPALNDSTPGQNLVRALRVLGQRPPTKLETASPAEVLNWGEENWRRPLIPLHSRTEESAHGLPADT